MSETASNKRYRPETKLVHAGALRSQYGETSEALFLTQGFIYDTAEECEARFKGEDPGFLYSRFSNPNISMFERRMIELEGAQAARATATAMGYEQVEFRDGLAEALPVDDGWADVVISNGVLNLCADKRAAFAEIWRVLQPGGWLQFADIANGRPVPVAAIRDVDLWTG